MPSPNKKKLKQRKSTSCSSPSHSFAPPSPSTASSPCSLSSCSPNARHSLRQKAEERRRALWEEKREMALLEKEERRKRKEEAERWKRKERPKSVAARKRLPNIHLKPDNTEFLSHDLDADLRSAFLSALTRVGQLHCRAAAANELRRMIARALQEEEQKSAERDTGSEKKEGSGAGRNRIEVDVTEEAKTTQNGKESKISLENTNVPLAGRPQQAVLRLDYMMSQLLRTDERSPVIARIEVLSLLRYLSQRLVSDSPPSSPPSTTATTASTSSSVTHHENTFRKHSFNETRNSKRLSGESGNGKENQKKSFSNVSIVDTCVLSAKTQQRLINEYGDRCWCFLRKRVNDSDINSSLGDACAESAEFFACAFRKNLRWSDILFSLTVSKIAIQSAAARVICTALRAICHILNKEVTEGVLETLIAGLRNTRVSRSLEWDVVSSINHKKPKEQKEQKERLFERDRFVSFKAFAAHAVVLQEMTLLVQQKAIYVQGSLAQLCGICTVMLHHGEERTRAAAVLLTKAILLSFSAPALRPYKSDLADFLSHCRTDRAKIVRDAAISALASCFPPVPQKKTRNARTSPSQQMKNANSERKSPFSSPLSSSSSSTTPSPRHSTHSPFQSTPYHQRASTIALRDLIAQRRKEKKKGRSKSNSDVSVEVFFPPRSLPTKTRASPKEDEVKVDGKEEQSEREMLAGESNDGNGNDDTSFEFDSILRDTPEQHNRGAFIATSDSLWAQTSLAETELMASMQLPPLASLYSPIMDLTPHSHLQDHPTTRSHLPQQALNVMQPFTVSPGSYERSTLISSGPPLNSPFDQGNAENDAFNRNARDWKEDVDGDARRKQSLTPQREAIMETATGFNSDENGAIAVIHCTEDGLRGESPLSPVAPEESEVENCITKKVDYECEVALSQGDDAVFSLMQQSKSAASLLRQLQPSTRDNLILFAVKKVNNGCSDEDDDVREMCLEWVEEGLRLQEGEEHPLLLLLQQRK